MKMILAALLSTILMLPAFGQNSQGQNGNSQGQNGGHYRGAPLPLAGTGLPILVIAGGVYWVVMRLRRKRS
jgi:hypothetical protein